MNDVELWVVPFVDPDGCESGAYVRCANGEKIDVAWTDPPRYTELHAVMLDLYRMRECRSPFLFLDLRCTGHAERDTYFRTPPVRDDQYSRTRRFIDLFRGTVPEDLLTDRFVEAGLDGDVRPNAVTWITQRLGCPATSLHISYQGTPHLNFEIEHYQNLGYNLLRAIGEFAKQD